MTVRTTVLLISLVLMACSGPTPKSDGAGTSNAGLQANDETAFGPLEVGADYKTWKQVNTDPWLSPTHGNRFVNTYVNDVGYDAYIGQSEELPVGTIVVKESFESKEDQPSDVAGPIFVMEKREKGYDDANGDWWYAIHWEEIAPQWQDKVDGPIYWRGQSKKVDYCRNCHNGMDWADHMGGVPDDVQAWE